ncbi:hypothetical protein F4804DRAFT_93876 [Jackrogersella minutella]|nr:hypothetical protein F4804DRAFT_93876 [Jackrogersella minutella]
MAAMLRTWVFLIAYSNGHCKLGNTWHAYIHVSHRVPKRWGTHSTCVLMFPLDLIHLHMQLVNISRADLIVSLTGSQIIPSITIINGLQEILQSIEQGSEHQFL